MERRSNWLRSTAIASISVVILGYAAYVSFVGDQDDSRWAGIERDARLLNLPSQQGDVDFFRAELERLKPDITEAEMFVASAIAGSNVNAIDALFSLVPVKSRVGHVALTAAVQSQSLEMVQRLVSSGAPVDMPDSPGPGPLHVACREGLYDITEHLVNAGADVNRHAYKTPGGPGVPVSVGPEPPPAASVVPGDDRVDAGYTPLHYAVAGGHGPIASFLIEHGADRNRRSLSGVSPIDLAAKQRHRKLVIMLKAP